MDLLGVKHKIQRNHETCQRFASERGLSIAMLSQILRGYRQPTLPYRIALEEVVGKRAVRELFGDAPKPRTLSRDPSTARQTDAG